MTDNKPDLKVLQFPGTQKEEKKREIPKYVHARLEDCKKAAEEGKLRKLVMYYEVEAEEKDVEYAGTTLFWHVGGNIWEIIGSIEAVKAMALGTALRGTSLEEFEVDDE